MLSNMLTVFASFIPLLGALSSASDPSSSDTIVYTDFTPPEGYTMAPMRLSGRFGNMILNETMEGTIQEVIAELKLKYPDFDPDATGTTSGIEACQTPTKKPYDVDDPQWQDAITYDAPLCCPVASHNWVATEINQIEEALKRFYPEEAQGQTECTIPKGKCVRVSCDNGSAVFGCNQLGTVDITFWCGAFFSPVYRIRRSTKDPSGKTGCGYTDSQTGHNMMCGQIFNPSGEWNVVVTKADCKYKGKSGQGPQPDD